ncbi:hypothetical protein BDN71DRAFT_1449358, partial [Pleurotus eryngii]
TPPDHFFNHSWQAEKPLSTANSCKYSLQDKICSGVYHNVLPAMKKPAEMSHLRPDPLSDA